jgi:hypothetical protein
MRFDMKQAVRIATACVLATIFAVPQNLVAQAAAAHLVSSADLQKAVVSETQTRQQNLEAVQGFLSSERAVKALKTAHMDPQQVKNAVANLNDAELAQMAVRANKAQADFAAGNFSDRDLIVIILAIAVLVLIIVAVR